MSRIIINGKTVEADPSKPLIHACHEHGVDVPMYCYHPGLTPVGSCRICQVEIQQGELPPRIAVACRTPVVEGLRVETGAPRAHEARRECLEFLLKNHPLDCPICDKAGECDLQDYAFNEGQGEGRTFEPRRKLEKRKSLGDVIVLDQERCILCSRCVRFMEEVPKTPQLTVEGLGSRSVISTFMDRPLTGNYQGNLADVCPVGALTLKDFRFRARVWNLRKVPSTCAECSRGCSITTEVLRGGRVARFRPRFNPDVNGYWMCDTGRFALDPANAADRLCTALVRGYSGLEEVPLEAALARAIELLRDNAGALLIASPFATQEEGELLAQLAKSLGSKTSFISPAENGLKDDVLHTGDPCPNRRGLTELGFEPLSPEQALAAIEAAPLACIAGERAVALLGGEEALAKIGGAARMILFDLHACDAPAVEVCAGIASYVERSGHWINVNGVGGRIAPARPAPKGVRTLEEHLQRLARDLSAAGAVSG